MCGQPAACGQQVPSRRRKVKVRGLCQRHADAVFGVENPPWQRLDAKTQRDIVNEWLRGMTILAHGEGRSPEELMAEIARVNETRTDAVHLVSPLLPGEAHDLHEAERAQSRLRSRETTVHAVVTQILIDMCATATGETHSEVLQRLALALDAWLDEPDEPGTAS